MAKSVSEPPSHRHTLRQPVVMKILHSGRFARGAMVFIAAGTVALLFSLYTSHTWEDYFITYRSSHNLATGHGLVYNHGDRLHTFTSPIGVLLPAAASLLTGNTSDAAALWVFRGFSIVAFAGAATLLFATTTRLRYPLIAACALVGWLSTDAKSVDFSINGMETGFLLLFFAYSFWALFAPVSRSARMWHLGAAWIGLMWTRPDSFIYIGLFFGALVVFNRRGETDATRAEWLRQFARAAAIAAILYLPWLLFSWQYYGSPVPHTIVAKSGAAAPRSFIGFADFVVHFPWRIAKEYSVLRVLFMPSYPAFGGWPRLGLTASGWVAGTAMLLWILPWLRTETRAASLALLGAIAYLTYFPPAVFPWYLCLPALLAFIALAGAAGQALEAIQRLSGPLARRLLYGASLGLIVASLTASGWLLIQVARQVRGQQTLIEDGNRRLIGLWLREHARPGETVMLEPLGYIGYYSGLKMFDVPGLSSREVVAAIRRVGIGWGHLAEELDPTWLVLREPEIASINATSPQLLAEKYESVRIFDVRPRVEELGVYGRPYLEFDSRFTVFRRHSDAQNDRASGE